MLVGGHPSALYIYTGTYRLLRSDAEDERRVGMERERDGEINKG